MRFVVSLLVVLAAAGCGGSAARSAAPATPAPTEEATRAPEDVAAVLSDSIGLLYCEDDPKAAWCKSIAKDGDAYAVEVDGNSVFIRSKLKDNAKGRDTAAEICTSIAAANFDEQGEPLGIDHVHVFNAAGDKELAKCNRPGY
jgi:hypothetical protein